MRIDTVCGEEIGLSMQYTAEEHLNKLGIRENFPRVVPLDLNFEGIS